MKRNNTVKLATCLLAAGVLVASLHAQNFTFTTIAGGSQGAADGVNSGAQFYNPTGLAGDGGGNVYVADQANNLIRKVSPLGTNWIVTTLAGGARGSLDGTNTSAQFSGPAGIAVDSAGNLYVADQNSNIIRRLAPSGTNWAVTTIAGTAGVSGLNDGANGGASFSNPTGVAVDGAGDIFVADEVNNAIRKITPSGTNWIVTTIAGGTQGRSDGTNTDAQFWGPAGVAVDPAGRIFVADQFNNAIRLIAPVGTNWVVRTIAGQAVSGLSDGLGANARFYAPLGVAVDAHDNVYVADEVNNAIRKLAPVGTNWMASTNWMVSTLGGGSQGSSDGTGSNAGFNLPFAVAADAYGDVFVADSQNNAIRIGTAAGSAPPTGGLQVMITSSNAIAEGAEWQLDGGPSFQTNGAILSGLVPGNHSINFTAASGYTTPAAQIIPVTARQTALATGNYAVAIANAGSLQVILAPLGAPNAGAQWKVDSGSWQASGAIVAGLSLGAHNLNFYPLPGWTDPSSQVVAVTNSQTTLATGTYVLQTGALQVSVLPSAVVAAGAKWYLDGGTAPHASDTTLSGLLPGAHRVSFNTVLGWEPVASQVVTIANALTTSAAATYTRPPQLAGTTAFGAEFQFVLRGPVGGSYIIQASTDLAGWTSISTNAIPAGGSIAVHDPDMTNYVRRFYRAITVTTSPPQLAGLTASRATAQFVLNGQSGSECVIQASSNLVTWSAILTNIIPDSGSMQITDPGATNQNRRFYRAVGR
jgi:hypothetical protein